jgi:predicted transcriptional regulator
VLLLSLRREPAEAIYAGSKRCELRKSRARVVPGDRVAIYETKPKGAITGTFIVEETHHAPLPQLWEEVDDAGISKERFMGYFATRRLGFAIRIRDARRLDREIELALARGIDSSFRPPQSFLYLEEKNPLVAAIRAQLSTTKACPADRTGRFEGGYEQNSPSPRVSHAQHLGPERMIVFGGQHLPSRHFARLAD